MDASKMYRFLPMLLSLGLCSDAVAVIRLPVVGAREASLGGAVSALQSSFSIFSNQSLMCGIGKQSVAVSCSQPYQLDGFYQGAVAWMKPVGHDAVGLGLWHSSFSGYTETVLGAAVAKKLSEKLAAGLLINGYTLNFPESGTRKVALKADASLSFRAKGGLVLGLNLKNLAGPGITTNNFILTFPFVAQGGVAYNLSPELLLLGDIGFEKVYGTFFRIGSEVKLHESFRLRGGISTQPFRYAAGFGYVLKLVDLDFAVVHHPLLGYSPVISFVYNLPQGKR